jgi:predicted DNA-binding transcriptional regulator AlpA
MINDGEFPAQISVGNRQVRWSRKEVLDWCDEKLVTGK